MELIIIIQWAKIDLASYSSLYVIGRIKGCIAIDPY